MKRTQISIAIILLMAVSGIAIIFAISAPAVALNPQPLPPGSQPLHTRYDPSSVLLNPQPLPPKAGYSPYSTQIDPDTVQLNPQPLPPKALQSYGTGYNPTTFEYNPPKMQQGGQIGGFDRSTIQNLFPGQPGVSYSPQTQYNPNTVPQYAQPSLSQQVYTGYNPATVQTSL